MTQERLNRLAILSIENEILKKNEYKNLRKNFTDTTCYNCFYKKKFSKLKLIKSYLK